MLLAAGSGERFGGGTPKQYVSLDGLPLVAYALKTLEDCPLVEQILVIAKEGTLPQMQAIIDDCRIHKAKDIIPGGTSRRDSVLRGLRHLASLGAEEDDLLAICDGDRPNQTCAMLEEGFRAAEKEGAAVVALPVSDSILYSEDGEEVGRYLPRERIYAAQTPQVFRFALIKQAHERALGDRLLESCTDDASLVRASGGKVKIIAGSPDNIKINTRKDALCFRYGKEEEA